MIQRVCKVCGKEFETHYPKQVLCGPECVKTSRLEWQRRYAQRYKDNDKKRKHKQKVKKEEQIKKQVANKNDLVITAVAARAAGMTYGQYVAMQSAQCNRIIRKVLK